MDLTCVWKYDEREDDYWMTTCGAEWCLEAGTPEENNYAFCPKCGRKIEYVPISQDGEEE